MSPITLHPSLTAQPSRHQHLIHILPRLQYDRPDRQPLVMARNCCKCFHASAPLSGCSFFKSVLMPSALRAPPLLSQIADSIDLCPIPAQSISSSVHLKLSTLLNIRPVFDKPLMHPLQTILKPHLRIVVQKPLRLLNR